MDASTVRRVRRLPFIVWVNEFTYRFEVATFTVLMIGRIFLFAVLWHAVYSPGEVAAGMTSGVASGATACPLAALTLPLASEPIKMPTESVNTKRVRDSNFCCLRF